MNIIRIVFVAVFTGAAFGMSILTAKAYALGFRLSPGTSRTLLIVAICIPILFIGGTLLGQIQNSPITKALTYPTNVAAGLALYLFLSAVILSIAILLYTAFGGTLPLFIPIVCLTIGLGFGIIGLFEAKAVKITSYTVPLHGAPKEWNKKTAVLVSDTHFGLINHRKFSDKIVNKILLLNPDFVLHAGDFYDGPKNDTKSISDSWKTLTDSIPVFYAPGNHEGYGDYAAFIGSIRNAGVTVLEDSVADYDGIQIAGITYRGKKDELTADRALRSMTLDKEKALILINHPPTFQAEALDVGTDLMVSGHTHKGQFWPGVYMTRMVYGRFYYGLQEYKNLFTITTSGVGTAGPPFRLFNTPELVVIHFTTE